METKYQHTVNGQAVYEEDLNLLGTNAALADDRVLAELVRMQPFGADVARGILPYRIDGFVSAPSLNKGQCTVEASTGGVIVHPFRAFIGTRTSAGVGTVKDNWRDIRSTIMVGASALDSAVSFDSTTTEQRIDLVYAAVAVDANATAVDRKVKDPTTGQITTVSLVTQKNTNVTLGVVKGDNNSTTLKNALSDGAGTYNIPLAYVHIPTSFGDATPLNGIDVWEVARTVSLSESTGAAAIRIASGNWDPAGTVQSRTPFDFTGRQPASVPAVMNGGQDLIAAIDLFTGGTASHNSGDAIDSIHDWTKRLWRVDVAAIPGAGGPKFVWESGGGTVPSYMSFVGAASGTMFSGFGQSLYADMATGKAYVAHMTSANFAALNAGSVVDLYVDMATGALKVEYSGAPNVKLFCWLRATAQFGNQG